MLPGDTTFEGGCQGSEVHIELLSPMSGDWLLRFKAPEGEPLRAGAYEGVTAIASNRPHATMSVAGREESCTTVAGRFVIHEIDLTGDRVNRLRLSFEQRCDGNPATLHGELSVANLNVAGTSTTASLR
jgi:hypothetical protein